VDLAKDPACAGSLARSTTSSGTPISRTVLIGITLAGAILASSLAAQFEGPRAAIDRRFADELETLAKKCEELNLDRQAEQTRNWLLDRDPQRQYLFVPEHPDSTEPPAAASKVIRFWYKHFRTARDKHADELFELSKQRLEQGRPAAAYQLLHEVLRDSPDHAEARRVLGYRKHLGRWQRGSDRVSSRVARVPHALFGWAPRSYWRVETQHFEITTNHSVKEGKALGGQLELLYDVWRQVFYEVWAGEDDLAAAFAGERRRARPAKKHRVVLFRDREQYVAQLSKHVAGIEVSEGFYAPERQTSYFFAGDKETVATWFHEVTHQLFNELAPGVPDVGVRDNFWITEGIAMYMESLLLRDGYVTLGGFDAQRLQHARLRAFNQRFYVPLGELISLGREDMQKDERLRALYTQSAGLAHFLMDYQSGRFRKAAVDYLRIIYAGRERIDTLERLTAVPLAEIDKAYVEFLDVTDEEVARYLRPPESLTKLLLGHTSVTDAALKSLGKATQLQWLDLTGTKITDEGAVHLGGAVNMVDLNLEGTGITDQSLRVIEKFERLEQLDLSGTNVTDQGMSSVAKLPNLKELWLTRTAISDAGLKRLEALKSLEMLDTRGTQVTVTGLKRLKDALPNLQD